MVSPNAFLASDHGSKAALSAGGITWPLRLVAASVTMDMVRDACSPPITAVLALGHEKQNRG